MDDASPAVNTGGQYDPATDTWTPTSLVGAPSGRHFHSAIWTGSRMVIWGGVVSPSGAVLNTGGVYDPVRDTWSDITAPGAPSPRWRHAALWTGSRMVIWGGIPDSSNSALSTGGIYYDPALLP